MTPHVPNPNQTSDAALEAALSTRDDVILPSSGFADAVMTAIRHEATAPAPIAFPWKRAIPGFVAAAGALVFLIAMIVALFRFRAAAAAIHAPVPQVIDLSWFTQFAHSRFGPDALWVAVALAIPLLCVLLMRKLLFAR